MAPRDQDTRAIELLAKAAFHNRIDEAKALLEQGVDPNATVNSISILGYAIGQRDQPEMVRLLLDAGANPNGAPSRDELVKSAACAHPNVLRVLLDAGADLHWVNDDGRSALWYAIEHGQKECEAILRERGLDYTQRELKDAEKARRLKNQQTIVRNRIRSARTTNAEELGWLMREAMGVDLPKEVVKLLRRGAVPNFREEHDQATPLVWAADKGYLDVIQAATKSDSQVDEKVLYEELAMEGTALAFAARAGHVKAVKALVEAGANVNAVAVGEDGQGPPLFFAERRGHKKVCDYLRPLTKQE